MLGRPIKDAVLDVNGVDDYFIGKMLLPSPDQVRPEQQVDFIKEAIITNVLVQVVNQVPAQTGQSFVKG